MAEAEYKPKRILRFVMLKERGISRNGRAQTEEEAKQSKAANSIYTAAFGKGRKPGSQCLYKGRVRLIAPSTQLWTVQGADPSFSRQSDAWYGWRLVWLARS